MSRSGPPLLPGSMGMASWIMRRPSISRTARDDAGDDAVLQPLRVAQGHDGLAVLQGVGVAQLQRRQALGVDADHGQVGGAVGGVDGGDLVALAVGQLAP